MFTSVSSRSSVVNANIASIEAPTVCLKDPRHPSTLPRCDAACNRLSNLDKNFSVKRDFISLIVDCFSSKCGLFLGICFLLPRSHHSRCCAFVQCNQPSLTDPLTAGSKCRLPVIASMLQFPAACCEKLLLFNWWWSVVPLYRSTAIMFCKCQNEIYIDKNWGWGSMKRKMLKMKVLRIQRQEWVGVGDKKILGFWGKQKGDSIIFIIALFFYNSFSQSFG